MTSRYRPTISAEYIVTTVKRHRFVAFGVLVLLAFFGIGTAVYKFANDQQTAANPFTMPQKLNINRLATSGKVLEVAISPDGKYAAYVSVVSIDRLSIRLRHLATSSDVEIVQPITLNRLINLSFTPDSNYLYYVRIDRKSGEETIYKVSVLGGLPTKIAEKTDGGASVSPDGKTIAFQRESEESGWLVLANPDGTNERKLVNLQYGTPNWISCGGVPAWSPDGKVIACGIHFNEAGKDYFKIIGINIADGSKQQLSEQEWAQLSGAVWLPDGNLIISGKEKSAEQFAPSQLWLISPNSTVMRITNDLNGYTGVSATEKGDVLVTLQARLARNLWIAPDNDASRAKKVTSSGEIAAGVQWMPDGKLVFGSNASGNTDIWMTNDDGTNRKQLTDNPEFDGFPSVTADGRYIVFHSYREGSKPHIFRMDADGSNLKQLTNGLGEYAPEISTDGKWVYYIAMTPGNAPNNLSKVSIDGGDPIVVSPARRISCIDASPRDGMIAFDYQDENQNWERKISIISPDGSAPIKILTPPPTAIGWFHWTPDGRSIAFNDIRNGGTNIWTMAIDGKEEPKPLTNFTTEKVLNFAWSLDGKQLVIIRDTSTSEAVLITKAK